MKIIYNKYIPSTGYIAINLFGVLFVRNIYYPVSAHTIRHEAIHTAQMRELLYIFFYLWYGIEWIVRLFQYRNRQDAYLNISFEREAYSNDGDVDYLKRRKIFAFIGYLKKV